MRANKKALIEAIMRSLRPSEFESALESIGLRHANLNLNRISNARRKTTI